MSVRTPWPLLALLLAPSASAEGADKDVLMVVWDTTRADHLSLYGYDRPTTPNLERVSEGAAVFEQAVPGGHWTAPSAASLFTGLFAHNHQVDFHPDKAERSLDLPEEAVTLAEAMKARGYRTAMLTNKKLVYENESFAQGFDEWRWVGAEQIDDEALAWMDGGGEAPWFVLTWYAGPHAPYDTGGHDEWLDPAGPEINIRSCDEGREWPEGWICWQEIDRSQRTLSEAEWADLRARYDGAIAWHDTMLGDLWAGLEARGIADEIVFAFTSDHGEAFNDHEHEKTWHLRPYENNQRVPLVVRAPGQLPAGRVPTAVRNLDLYPTLIAASGGAVDHPINGEDLAPVAAGEAADRPCVGFSHAGHGAAWYRDGDYKLVFPRSRPDSRNPKLLELYDLQADPLEQDNLALRRPELLAQLRADFEALVEETALEMQRGGEVRPEQIELLQQLGYLED